MDDKFNLKNLKSYITQSENSYINELLKNSDLKKKILIFELNSKRKIVLISINKDCKSADIESLGAEFHGRVNYGKNTEYFLMSDSINIKLENFLVIFFMA